ncbi:YidC/Oxa1 family membrane protein insertase [Actinoplanes sp. KI2]|uniref:YidC/Oxa1 family membrane protein insertase n=1 Tax=Actinoplanes sp. KI2 TaxID=2983315 RepID=UPI0021D5B48F|nr:YidC/Oxa1 family membrane protein insertase [Actinoplanes sp. KI2]MCU7724527.1 YidC/Oxa1 family membrane protein insertase [Actinoplanes sp. KI2]
MSVLAIPGAVVGAAHSAIESLAGLFVPIAGGAAAALAIVVFTLLIRLLISPLTYQQVRAQRRQAALAPDIAKLREKHGKDPMTLATETLALQRAAGVSPFAAFLPALAQAPFFMVMYHVALRAPAGSLMGVPLTAHLAAGLPVFAVLLALSVALAWWSSRRMSASMASATPGAPSMGFLRYLPYLSVLAVAWMPLAGGIYLVTSTAWTAIEQAVYRRPVTTGNR